MKRIVVLVCGMLFLVTGVAEARWTTPTRGTVYSQPVYTQPVYRQPVYTQPARVAPVHYSARPIQSAQPIQAAAASFSTHTAQGVANIMASQGRVGHFGGNTGYEGCGMGATPDAAFRSCCYSNSGMTTVDVGYAQGGNGMWYCCRRYR